MQYAIWHVVVYSKERVRCDLFSLSKTELRKFSTEAQKQIDVKKKRENEISLFTRLYFQLEVTCDKRDKETRKRCSPKLP